MLKSERQKSICRKYSARDKDGYVHCNSCPLIVDRTGHMCRSNSHYDRKLKEWVPDNITTNLSTKEGETSGSL